MKLFRLLETFDSNAEKYSFKKKKDGYYYNFRVDKTNYVSFFMPIPKGYETLMTKSKKVKEGDKIYSFAFGINAEDPEDLDMGITYTGNVGKVFLTISNIINDFFKKVKPDFLMFSSSGPESRDKFYAKFVPLFCKKNNFELVEKIGENYLIKKSSLIKEEGEGAPTEVASYGNYQPEQEQFPALGKTTTKSLRGYKIPHVLFGKQIKNRIKKILKKKKTLKEDLNTTKFFYTNWKNDKFPEVKILDYHYKKDGEKNKSDDLLGWNLNYFKNKKEASQSIDDIDSFARLISANNKEKYQRIKYFFPEQAKHLRRYKKDKVKYLKIKDGLLWKNTNLKDLEEKHKNNL